MKNDDETFKKRCGAAPRKKRLHKTQNVRFQTKPFRFRVIARFVQKRNIDSNRKRLHTTKNACFSNKNVPFSCHCEEHSDVAIFKPKVWHPVARQGSTRREEIPITEAAKRAIPPSPLSPPHFQIPVRSVSSCLVPGWQIVPSKIAASGAHALLAMTKSAGFVEKRNGFQNE